MLEMRMFWWGWNFENTHVLRFRCVLKMVVTDSTFVHPAWLRTLVGQLIWSATLQCASYHIVILAYNTPLLFLPGCFLQWSLFVIVQMKALCKNPLIIHRILTCMKWDMLDNLTLDYGYPWSCADDAVSEWLRAYASSQLQGRCQHQVITGLDTVFWQASIEKARDRQVLIHAVATWSKAARCSGSHGYCFALSAGSVAPEKCYTGSLRVWKSIFCKLWQPPSRRASQVPYGSVCQKLDSIPQSFTQMRLHSNLDITNPDSITNYRL